MKVFRPAHVLRARNGHLSLHFYMRKQGRILLGPHRLRLAWAHSAVVFPAVFPPWFPPARDVVVQAEEPVGLRVRALRGEPEGSIDELDASLRLRLSTTLPRLFSRSPRPTPFVVNRRRLRLFHPNLAHVFVYSVVREELHTRQELRLHISPREATP